MNELEALYRKRFEQALKPIALAIDAQLREYLARTPRIDKISARAKEVKSFLTKSSKMQDDGRVKYGEPLAQIQDQIGVRIVTFYNSDVPELDKIVKKYYKPIEEKQHVPDSEWAFGYFGRHYVLHIPSDAIGDEINRELVPHFFELQIKTLFQHAWSEAEHDLGYKSGDVPLSPDEERRLAFTSAQAWGADQIFDELFVKRMQGTMSVEKGA
jgi:putative GTP pyrophosphokinase